METILWFSVTKALLETRDQDSKCKIFNLWRSENKYAARLVVNAQIRNRENMLCALLICVGISCMHFVFIDAYTWTFLRTNVSRSILPNLTFVRRGVDFVDRETDSYDNMVCYLDCGIFQMPSSSSSSRFPCVYVGSLRSPNARVSCLQQPLFIRACIFAGL